MPCVPAGTITLPAPHRCGRLRRRGQRCPRPAPHLLAVEQPQARGQFAGWTRWRACGPCARVARRHGAVRIPPTADPKEFLAKLRVVEPAPVGPVGRGLFKARP